MSTNETTVHFESQNVKRVNNYMSKHGCQQKCFGSNLTASYERQKNEINNIIHYFVHN